ncbi:MAG: mandelate racemase/muconate lactonizing enzyme family protein [Chloroflexota bacterium]
MRIERVETFLLRAPLNARYGFAQRMRSHRSAVMVKITSDDGVVGWGQCGAPSQDVVRNVLDQEIAPLLIGQDPFLIEEIWQRVIGSFSPYGVQGMTFMALSGVDVALWDLKARALELPLWRLLGAKFRDKVLAYASGPYYFADEVIPDQAAAEALKYCEQGFRAMKIKIGGLDPRDDIRRVEGVRKAVGDEVTLMVDANQAYNAHTAIRVGRELEQLNVLWFEEPVPCTDIEGYIRVRQALRIAIAGGEVEWSRFGFRDLICRGALDIVQPDLGDSGGFTECKRIAALADAWGVHYMPHVVSSTPIGLPAALHMIATLRNFPNTRTPTPFNQAPALEFHRQPNPLRDELVKTPIEAVDGYVTIPDGPGLGIEIDEEAVRRFAV